MILESLEHPASCFITLTYAPEHLPHDGSLSKEPLQLFLKRLRDKISPRKIRFYAVGEYGDKSWRPHFHLIVFGLSCTEEDTIKACWPWGHIHVGQAEAKSMQYCSGYITKHMTKKTDRRLNGRHPEFCTMSLKPGIGIGISARIAASYHTESGQAALQTEKWISERVRLNGHKYPLGRYLRDQTLKKMGITANQQKDHRREVMERVYERKSLTTTTEYEKSRKARVQQQTRIKKGRRL